MDSNSAKPLMVVQREVSTAAAVDCGSIRRARFPRKTFAQNFFSGAVLKHSGQERGGVMSASGEASGSAEQMIGSIVMDGASR